MVAIISVILGFVLTGLIGNRLSQEWQARSWRMQQRFFGKEKEYIAFKELADEIARLIGVRVYRMQRLVFNLRETSEEKFIARRQELDEIVRDWNERLTSFYVRISILSQPELADRLEKRIQNEFVSIHSTIERLLKLRDKQLLIDPKDIQQVDAQLSSLQGKVISFNKEMLSYVEKKRTNMYLLEEMKFTAENLEKFSTWHLIKALFVREIDSLTVTRSSLDV